MTRNDEKEMYERKVKILSDESCPAHVKLKNGRFYNGYIYQIEEQYFIINDRVLGKVRIFFFEIEHIEEFKEDDK